MSTPIRVSVLLGFSRYLEGRVAGVSPNRTYLLTAHLISIHEPFLLQTSCTLFHPEADPDPTTPADYSPKSPLLDSID